MKHLSRDIFSSAVINAITKISIPSSIVSIANNGLYMNDGNLVGIDFNRSTPLSDINVEANSFNMLAENGSITTSGDSASLLA
jgi:hypothetical protein